MHSNARFHSSPSARWQSPEFLLRTQPNDDQNSRKTEPVEELLRMTNAFQAPLAFLESGSKCKSSSHYTASKSLNLLETKSQIQISNMAVELRFSGGGIPDWSGEWD
jgi:hypothetical protein